MPLNVYDCRACGARHEALQKFSDPDLDICPQCGQSGLRKHMGSPTFRLKGAGWYVTDYGGGSSSVAGKAGDDAPSPAANGTSEGTSGGGHVHSSGCGCAAPAPSAPAPSCAVDSPTVKSA